MGCDAANTQVKGHKRQPQAKRLAPLTGRAWRWAPAAAAANGAPPFLVHPLWRLWQTLERQHHILRRCRTLKRPGVGVGASCSSCQWCAAAAAAAGCLKNAAPAAAGPAIKSAQNTSGPAVLEQCQKFRIVSADS